MEYHLAEINIARMVDEIYSPAMAGFVAQLDEINALAEGTPGYVWRLKNDLGDATSIRVFNDNYLIINMSVWTSIEALFEFTYKSGHVEVYRRRREWFNKLEKPYFAMWWIPAGHIPTPEEAKTKLDHIEKHGVTPHAFTFKQRFSVEEWLALMENERVSSRLTTA